MNNGLSRRVENRSPQLIHVTLLIPPDPQRKPPPNDKCEKLVRCLIPIRWGFVVFFRHDSRIIDRHIIRLEYQDDRPFLSPIQIHPRMR